MRSDGAGDSVGPHAPLKEKAAAMMKAQAFISNQVFVSLLRPDQTIAYVTNVYVPKGFAKQNTCTRCIQSTIHIVGKSRDACRCSASGACSSFMRLKAQRYIEGCLNLLTVCGLLTFG
jgi:hypothetical protein